MGETRRKFDQDFKEGAVRLVRETGKPIAQVARELGIVPGTLENWVAKDRRAREGGDGRLSEDERAELVRLRHGGYRGRCRGWRPLPRSRSGRHWPNHRRPLRVSPAVSCTTGQAQACPSRRRVLARFPPPRFRLDHMKTPSP